MASFLVDTCVLIWATSDPEKLSKKSRRMIDDDTNRVFVSHATLGEMSIKVNIGELEIEEGFFGQLEGLGYEILPMA